MDVKRGAELYVVASALVGCVGEVLRFSHGETLSTGTRKPSRQSRLGRRQGFDLSDILLHNNENAKIRAC